MQSAKWSLADILQKLPPDSQLGKRYTQPATHGSMRLGLYAPRGHDPQQPHDQDELYFVVSGTGTFVHGDRQDTIEPGDALFVAAGVVHRFEAFSDDFAAWVVFWGPPGGE